MWFTFTTTYLNISKNTFWYRINLLIGLTFSILNLSTNWIIKGVNYLPWFPYPQAGALHIFFIIHCVYLMYFSLRLIINAIKDKGTPPRSSNILKYMTFALVVLSLGMLDFIPNYGIKLYPIGSFTSTAFLLIVSAAVLKHQLMDIQIAIKKGLLYSFLISFITFMYVALVLIVERLILHNYSGLQALPGFLTACLIAIIFTPLRNKLQEIIDKKIFRNTTVQIAEENQLLREEIMQTEKFKAVATLASGIAHEIRNPLTAIQTFNTYLPQKKDDPEFMAKYHGVVGRETARINNLIQELLSFAKPSPPQIKTINPDQIINELIVLIEQKCASHKILIDKDLTANAIIQADPDQLKQALLNILLNAIDAMPNEGTLTIETKPERGDFTISITDTGCGIDPKDLPHIFEPFYTKKEKGTGLGLAITQGIVEKNNGRNLSASLTSSRLHDYF